MISVQEESWYLSVCDGFDAFLKRVEEKIVKEQQQLKQCEKRKELEYKLAQEHKLNTELKEQLSELNHRRDELENVCTIFSKINITDNDQQRLDNAKEAFELAKQLTGIRFDFSAPQNIMKGYIKNEPRRVLLPFEMEINTDALWDLMNTASDPSWLDKENHSPN